MAYEPPKNFHEPLKIDENGEIWACPELALDYAEFIGPEAVKMMREIWGEAEFKRIKNRLEAFRRNIQAREN